MLVHARVSKPAVEQFDHRIIRGPSTPQSHLFQAPNDGVSGQPLSCRDDRILTAVVIDERQQPERLPADRLIDREVHAQALIGLSGRRP